MNKKGKVLLLTMLCGMLAAGGFAACGGGDDGSDSSSIINSSSSVEEQVASLTMNKETLTMDLYSTNDTLSVLKENVTGDVVWSCSDESVLAIAGNVLTAKKVGTATVTASIGAYSDTCTVTVVAGSKTLQFTDLEDMTLSQGAEYSLDGTLTYDGVAFPFATVTFTAETGKDLLTVTQDGKIQIAANKSGSQKITATATFDGATVATKEFTVSVQEYGSIDTGLLKNELTLIKAEQFDGLDFYALSNIKGYVNGLETEEELVYEIQSGSDVVAVTGDKISALQTGEAVIKVYFTAESTNIYDAVIHVAVEELATDSLSYFTKNNTKYEEITYAGTLTTGEMLLDVAQLPTPLNISEIQELKVNNVPTEFAQMGATTLIRLPKQACGEADLTFVKADALVNLELLVVDYVISDFSTFYKYMKEDRATAMYAILTADIISTTGAAASTACGENIANAEGGTFDGNGYTISGIYTYRGWFGGSSANGAQQKHFTMKNATIDNHIIATGSIFGYYMNYCTFENLNWTVVPDVEFFKQNCNFLVTYSYYSTFTNCNFKMVVPDGCEGYKVKIAKDEPNATTGVSYYKSTYTNVTFESNGLIADFGEQDAWGYQTSASAAITGSSYTVIDASSSKEN